jgi:hypothetical protein
MGIIKSSVAKPEPQGTASFGRSRSRIAMRVAEPHINDAAPQHLQNHWCGVASFRCGYTARRV